MAKSSIGKLAKRVILERDGCCLKCGASECLTIDHIKPRALGGANRFENMQTLCLRCNVDKGIDEVDYRKESDKIIEPFWYLKYY